MGQQQHRIVVVMAIVLSSTVSEAWTGYGHDNIASSAPNAAIRELMKAALTKGVFHLKDGRKLLSLTKPRQALSSLEEESIRDANYLDMDDCGKKLLCELTRKSDLQWDEEMLINTFSTRGIDYKAQSLMFDIAVQVGKSGASCSSTYLRCVLELEELLQIFRRQGITFDIPGDERDCQVYFLWKKKDEDDIDEDKINIVQPETKK